MLAIVILLISSLLVNSQSVQELMVDPNMTVINDWTVTGASLCQACSQNPDVGPWSPGGYYLYIVAGDTMREITLIGDADIPEETQNATLEIYYWSQYGKQFAVEVFFESFRWYWTSDIQPGFNILNTTIQYTLGYARKEPLTITVTTGSGPGDILSINRVSMRTKVPKTNTFPTWAIALIIITVAGLIGVLVISMRGRYRRTVLYT